MPPTRDIAKAARCLIVAYAFVAGLHVTPVSASEDKPYYFYKKTDVGSEAAFSPLSAMINVGYDLFRSGSYQNRIAGVDYQTGIENIYDNVIHLNRNIQLSGGWRDFAAYEVFPYREFGLSHGHFVPNYFLHVLGEGMLYRKMQEWYTERQYPVPRLMALGTIFASQLLNETVENGAYRGANNDPVADLVFFNPLGWLLFSFDEVARFFSEDITIGFWPGQPTIDLSDFSLYNAGESYFYRGGFDFMGPISLFGYMGCEGIGGLSWKFDETDSLTVAGGYRMI